MDCSCSTILALIVGVIFLLGFLWKKLVLDKNSDYWEKRGVETVKPSTGTLQGIFDILTRKKNVVDFDVELYNQQKGPYGGSTEFGKPVLLLKDPELIKHVLVKDFDHFVDRRKLQFDGEPLLNMMLSVLEGQEWKQTRSHMSPTFTTGKIRRMFENFNRVGEKLVDFIKSKPVGSPGKRDVVVKEAISRYLVDIIGATAFGMDTKSLEDPNSTFYTMSKKASEFSMWKLVKIVVIMAFPFVTKLGVKFAEKESWGFFEDILRKALKNRLSSGEKRDDFLQLMIEARKGELDTEEGDVDQFEKDAQLKTDSKAKVEMSDDMVVAQSLLFFLAGLDTTGSVLCFALYVLALHPDIQQKMFDEVEETMGKQGGNIDYDGIVHMEYMDKFISEILRKYPPGLKIERRCTKPYTLPGTNVIIEKDTLVSISALAMQNDPKHYPNPEKFDPERFTAEEKAKRNPYTYLPFGQGPRNCIGMRFALMEAKVALAYIIYNFEVEPCESTPIPIKLDPNIGSRPVTELELRFKQRKNLSEE